MRNIVITGGGMTNKGAQAMTFITVCELKKRFPDHRILLYSPEDVNNPEVNREKFTFDIIGWYPMKFALCQKNKMLRILCLLRNKKELMEAEEIYRKTDFIIDISGYAIGSNWSSKICNAFLDIIEFGKGFGIPIYLMPQSFGPFDFKGEEGKRIDARIRALFPYVKTIFAREKVCYDLLVDTYGFTNVRLANDLVLCNKGFDRNFVYRKEPNFNLPSVNENSIAIIPNSRNSSVGEHRKLIKLYANVINHLLQLGKNVYLITHSNHDIGICEELKSLFVNDDKVEYLSNGFSCLEFNEIVKKFDYVIASRFHSIVHAYKNGIPCIALGWAGKYKELLSLFGQEKYMFDVRGDIDADSIINVISKLDRNVQDESAKILEKLEEVQKENVFDILG